MLVTDFSKNLTKSEFSVSEISSRIKYLLEQQFTTIRIRGEISGLKIAASGHGYFSLKDHNAVIATTCWRHNLNKLNFKLEEGIEVIATGKITAYAGQSKYQLAADYIEPAGEGAFRRILKERQEKLAKEGLFNQEYKQQIPLLPRKIGIITSMSGAVIKDIIDRITDRCGTNLLIWPVAVQGETSAQEVTNAINGFNQLEKTHQPDILIIARGGGSIEDLWSFNEEIVVRAVYHSKIPIISAIGHETDYSLTDLAADIRASTPTEAADHAVPILSDLKFHLATSKERLIIRINDLLKYQTQLLLNHQRALRQVQHSVDQYAQKLDDLMFRLVWSLPNLLKQKQNQLAYLATDRFNSTKLLAYKYLQYNHLANRLADKGSKLLAPYAHKLSFNTSLLASLDYNRVLKRGYAMISDQQGNYISTIKNARSQKSINLKMQDGELKLDL